MDQGLHAGAPPPRGRLVRFGPFEFDVRAGELRKYQVKIRLQEQPCQILLMLLENPGEAVLREEIRKRLWPNDTIVEFDHSINAAIKKLREALGDSADDPRYVETVARRGYRFIGTVEPAARPPTPAFEPGDPSQRTIARVTAIGKRSKVVVLAGLILLLTAGSVIGLLHRNARAHWARDEALPEITRQYDEGRFTPAYELAAQAEKYIPDDGLLARLWPTISRRVTIQTTPSGATVYRKDYDSPDGRWERVGVSPLEDLRMPRGLFAWKIEKRGFATVEGSLFPMPEWSEPECRFASVILDQEGQRPEGMVRVSPGNRPTSLEIPGFDDVPPIKLEDYWIDKYEVTNKQFKEFVIRGGYQKPEYWKQDFRKNGNIISWTDAMALFRDATGRPGPAGWMQSDYPAGQDDYPVSGVSWYEAVAYAEFAGKALPTIWHWNKAAGSPTAGFVVPNSNFRGQGPARVGSYRGLGPWGTYDMGGNVKEWCWNEARGGLRYILGGGWDEPGYMFEDPDARSPLDRSATLGFRCVRYFSPGGIPKAATDPVPSPARDYNREKPVSDDLFRAYKGLYSYDKSPLNAAVELIDESDENWKREKITFDAAYGSERVIAYLFLPRNFTPPLQTVVYFPGSNVISNRSSAILPDMFAIDFVIKSGRAVLYPVYKGTFERGDGLNSDVPNMTSSYRDHVIAWSKDLGRSIDYLETRPEIDHNKLAYYGLSWGAAMGAVLPAIETRIKACVFFVGGFYFQRALPEADQINFAPRVKVPVLMLNGRYDFYCPVQACQLPLYRLLGTPAEYKVHMLYEGGHNIPRNELIKETLNWFDRYLGPVK